MADEREDFSPDDIVDVADPEPVALLKEQAALLGNLTGNVVEGIVKTSTEGENAYHSLVGIGQKGDHFVGPVGTTSAVAARSFHPPRGLDPDRWPGVCLLRDDAAR